MLISILILAVPTLIFLALPILTSQQTQLIDTANSLSIEREQSYAALIDLDDDFELGKISEADYLNLRNDLLNETADLISQIASPTENQTLSLEDEIARYKASRKS